MRPLTGRASRSRLPLKASSTLPRPPIAAVDLIKLGTDQRLYDWETIASLPLNGTQSS
jgi:hypothetical protein